MPIPLFWLALGATAIGTYSRLNTDKRLACAPALNLDILPEGAILCCGIYGVFKHTGVWAGEGIIELKGNGLVRQVSPERFLSQRSGAHIYIACSDNNRVLARQETADAGLQQLFHFKNYHVRTNNCYRFVWQCVSGKSEVVGSFTELEALLCHYFNAPIHWRLLC